MTGSISRRATLGSGLAAAALPSAARAQRNAIRIGVLTNMAGQNAANTGPGSVVGAQLAVEDFAKAHPDIAVEVIAADLQNKPDVALAIAGKWIDTDGVDLITDVPLSSAAFSISDLVRRKDKLAIFNGGATSEITGQHCGPNRLQWAYDTWSLPHAAVTATVSAAGDTWFFITADYELGHQLRKDAAAVVLAAHGTVLGNTLVPFPETTDFSAYLLQVQASGAKVLGLANGGADTINCVKQAAEFGITRNGLRMVSLLMRIGDVHGLGLSAAQGLLLSEPYYWDLNDGTRAFKVRYAARMNGSAAGSVHAGQYSAVTHYPCSRSATTRRRRADGRSSRR